MPYGSPTKLGLVCFIDRVGKSRNIKTLPHGHNASQKLSKLGNRKAKIQLQDFQGSHRAHLLKTEYFPRTQLHKVMMFHISLLTPHGAELKFYSAVEAFFMPTLGTRLRSAR